MTGFFSPQKFLKGKMSRQFLPAGKTSLKKPRTPKRTNSSGRKRVKCRHASACSASLSSVCSVWGPTRRSRPLKKLRSFFKVNGAISTRKVKSNSWTTSTWWRSRNSAKDKSSGKFWCNFKCGKVTNRSKTPSSYGRKTLCFSSACRGSKTLIAWWFNRQNRRNRSMTTSRMNILTWKKSCAPSRKNTRETSVSLRPRSTESLWNQTVSSSTWVS